MPRAPRASILVVLVLTLLAPAAVRAAGPKTIGTLTFVDRPGLAGIGVVGFTWTARNTVEATGGGSGAGKLSFDPFRIVKLLDATAPALFELTANGTIVPEVRLDVTIRRGTTASYVLSDVTIVANEHRSEGGVALQELSLAAAAIRATVTTPGGTVTSCYNLATISACE